MRYSFSERCDIHSLYLPEYRESSVFIVKSRDWIWYSRLFEAHVSRSETITSIQLYPSYISRLVWLYMIWSFTSRDRSSTFLLVDRLVISIAGRNIELKHPYNSIIWLQFLLAKSAAKALVLDAKLQEICVLFLRLYLRKLVEWHGKYHFQAPYTTARCQYCDILLKVTARRCIF